MKETATHIYFLKNWMSNFWRSNFTYKGIVFNTTEHAFMYEKAMFFGDYKTADAILKTSDPTDAKALGRKVTPFDPEKWREPAKEIMFKINLAKYQYNQGLRDKLLATNNKILVEANGKDTIWGVGLYENDPLILDEKNWRGDNGLGKTLMRVREELK